MGASMLNLGIMGQRHSKGQRTIPLQHMRTEPLPAISGVRWYASSDDKQGDLPHRLTDHIWVKKIQGNIFPLTKAGFFGVLGVFDPQTICYLHFPALERHFQRRHAVAPPGCGLSLQCRLVPERKWQRLRRWRVPWLIPWSRGSPKHPPQAE